MFNNGQKIIAGNVRKSTKEHPSGADYIRVITGNLLQNLDIDYMGIPDLNRIADILNTVFRQIDDSFQTNIEVENHIQVLNHNKDMVLSITDYPSFE